MPLLNRIFSKTSPLERKVSIVFICILFFIFVLLPLLKQNRSLSRQILQKEDRLTQYRQILEKEEMIRSQYRKFFPDAQNSVSDKSLISALKSLESLSNKYGLKIKDIRQNAQGQGDSTVLIEVLLAGKKEDYVRFIYDLANGSLLFNIKKCDFKTQENSYLLEAKFVISYLPVP
jgi:hypothetical protein